MGCVSGGVALDGINVRSYGAKGDGLTNDTTSAQQACTALSALGGGVLDFPPGTYVLDNLLIPSNIEVRGAGPGATILKSPASASVKTILANSDTSNGNTTITVRDLCLDGNKTNQNGNLVGFGLWFQKVSNSKLVNIEARNVDGTGVALSGAGTFTYVHRIDGIYAHDNAVNGVTLTYRLRDAEYSNIVAKANGQDGVYIDASEHTATNIEANSNTRYGIYIHNVHACTFSNLVANLNGSHGIYVLGMVYSNGSNWHASNNGTDGTTSNRSDMYFTDQIAASGYGTTNYCDFSNLWTGTDPSDGASTTEQYCLYLEDGCNGDLKFMGVHYGGGSTVGARYRVPTSVGNLVFMDYPDATNRLRMLVGEMRLGPGTNLQILGTATFSDSANIVLGTSAGTKIGTGANQKLGLWNAAPIVQPTTAVTAASFVANTSGIVNDTATFDGYTIGQIAKALRNIGVLA